MKHVQEKSKNIEINFSVPIYASILKEELERRIRTNSSYSLRAFAKQLDIDPSLLSKVIQGKRELGAGSVIKVIENSNLNLTDKDLFWQSFIRSKQKKYHEQSNLQDIVQLRNEQFIEDEIFKIIAEPHHYLIVELSRLKKFRADPDWISGITGVSSEEVMKSIERLVSIGMLTKKAGKITRGNGRFTTKDKTVTATALKYHQKKILEKAIEAMDKYPLKDRNQTSMTIAVNPHKIPIVKKMFEDFINQVSDVLEAGELEEVYQMSLSLFPLTSLSLKVST